MTKHALVTAVLAVLGAAAGFGAAGCGTSSTSSTFAGTTGTRPATTASLALPSSPVRFGRLEAVALRSGPAYAGPPTPHSLDGVKMVAAVRRAVEQSGAAGLLVKQGFAVVPSDLRLFHFGYQDSAYQGWPVFVTTDAAYHAWHLVFDKIVRDLEQTVLLPKLERLVSGLLAAAHAQTAEVAGTPLAETASRVEQLYQVATAELGLPTALGPLAVEEKALVDAHSAPNQPSPIVGGKIDYSLFTPRGHYTRNADLRRYFVAMSVLGQSAFCLPGTVDCPDGIEPVRTAILASRVIAARPDLVALWRDLYEPTAFLVGSADDYTPLEVADAARAASRSGIEDVNTFADDAAVERVLRALVAARPVLISPDRSSVRLMGTRFVVDSFVLDQLLYPYVGTPENKRLVPSGLDVAAAFGSGFAYGVLRDQGQTAYAHYDTQLAALRSAIASRPEAGWGSTVYDAWLWALEPEFVAHGMGFPDFMRTDAWAAKAQQSGLGSYAELKHDTILYAKQAVAEGGDNPRIPDRRNWVEPEPAVFGRLAAAADLMRTGLRDRGLLTPDAAGLLRTESDLFGFFRRIAADELAGRPISAKDNERLTYIGGAFEALFLRTADVSPSGAITTDQDAAIVADISSSSKGVLEVATGRIDRIYVLVPNDEGVFQVAVGAVYSYYEFTGPPGVRLTDEEWRAQLDAGTVPPRPAWEEVMLAG
jgi:hypothetical protein